MARPTGAQYMWRAGSETPDENRRMTMTTNHPLIGRKVKAPSGDIYTVVGHVGFQPAVDAEGFSDFHVPVIGPDGCGSMVSLMCLTVLDDKPAAEDESVAKLRALALLLCGLFTQEVNLNDMFDAMSVTGIDEDDSNDTIIEKALAIIEASR